MLSFHDNFNDDSIPDHQHHVFSYQTSFPIASSSG
jgi:hypothetical protein